VLESAARLLATTRQPAWLAISYIGRSAPEILRLKPGDVIVVNGSDNAVKAGATHPGAVATWLSAGVRVVNHERLHAKVIVVGRTAIVGSANVSQRAAGGMIAEAALKTTDPHAVANARAFVENLIKLEGEDIDQDWVEEAIRHFPKAGVVPAWTDTEPSQAGPFRLWLGWWNEETDWTNRDEEAYEEAVTEVPAAFLPRARYTPIGMIEEPAEDGRFRAGDRIIMLGRRDARLVDFRSIRAVPGSRKRRLMALYRRDHQHPRVTNATVRTTLERLNSALPTTEGEAGVWLTDPQKRRAVLALWVSTILVLPDKRRCFIRPCT
jgi:hypothetical protein